MTLTVIHLRTQNKNTIVKIIRYRCLIFQCQFIILFFNHFLTVILKIVHSVKGRKLLLLPAQYHNGQILNYGSAWLICK